MNLFEKHLQWNWYKLAKYPSEHQQLKILEKHIHYIHRGYSILYSQLKLSLIGKVVQYNTATQHIFLCIFVLTKARISKDPRSRQERCKTAWFDHICLKYTITSDCITWKLVWNAKHWHSKLIVEPLILKMAEGIKVRNISPLLQLLRNFLLGVKWYI